MYRIRTVWTGFSGAPGVSTMYFAEGGGTAQQAATAVGTFWGSVDNFIVSALSWRVENAVTLIDGTTGQATGVTQVSGPNGQGAATGDMVPRVAQALIRWRTGSFFGGREIRGRTFIPGISESNAIGTLSTAAISGIDAAAAALVGDANSLLLVWSRSHFLEEVVDAWETWTEFASLRSRRD